MGPVRRLHTALFIPIRERWIATGPGVTKRWSGAWRGLETLRNNRKLEGIASFSPTALKVREDTIGL